MSRPHASLEDRVESFRREFDESFSAPRRKETEILEEFIAIRVGGDAYLLRLGELAGLTVSRSLVALRSRRREFLGLVGHRGALVAVFSLPLLLGYPASGPAPRWIALLASGAPLGLGFDGYEGILRKSNRDLCGVGDAARRRYVTGALGQGGVTRAVLDLGAIGADLVRPTEKSE